MCFVLILDRAQLVHLLHTLFATTICSNIKHGLIATSWENASPKEKMKLVKEACIKANTDGFITKLPLGYNTMVGERSFLLSGGQKQCIAITCAIVSDPCILFLDEATSARLGVLNHESWKMYGFSIVTAAYNGAMYPSYGVVFSKAINTFSETDPH